ncbi:MAG: nucleotidyltransferase family protein [Candidatus Acidiferrales bacterium]|jgi:molybdenum cofactor cytidylyltransferase
MLAAAILAAGESRRMGKPKALLPYRGLSFVEHLLSATRHPRVGFTRVVLGAGAEDIRMQLAVPASQVIVNPDWPKGQLTSIHAALRSVPPGLTEGILICPVDHPLISMHLVARLIAEFDSSGKAIVLPTHLGRRGHPVIFRCTLYEELLATSPDVGARQVVWSHVGEIAEVPTEEEGVILNLNDPDTFARAIGKG